MAISCLSAKRWVQTSMNNVSLFCWKQWQTARRRDLLSLIRWSLNLAAAVMVVRTSSFLGEHNTEYSQFYICALLLWLWLTALKKQTKTHLFTIWLQPVASSLHHSGNLFGIKHWKSKSVNRRIRHCKCCSTFGWPSKVWCRPRLSHNCVNPKMKFLVSLCDKPLVITLGLNGAKCSN